MEMGRKAVETANPLCVECVNQPPVQPISAFPFLELCGEALASALVRVPAHRSLGPPVWMR